MPVLTAFARDRVTFAGGKRCPGDVDDQKKPQEGASMGKMSLRFFGGDVCALKDWQEEDDTVLFTISKFRGC